MDRIVPREAGGPAMPRRPRWMQLADGAAYHVLSRGHNREAVFADPADLSHFLSLLAR